MTFKLINGSLYGSYQWKNTEYQLLQITEDSDNILAHSDV